MALAKIMILAAVSFPLSACGYIPGTDAHYLKQAEEKAAQLLIDPSSAQFRNAKIAKSSLGKVACGEINGKNRMGAYVGFTLHFG